MFAIGLIGFSFQFLQALRQEKAELYGEGSVHLSQLLETDNVEVYKSNILYYYIIYYLYIMDAVSSFLIDTNIFEYYVYFKILAAVVDEGGLPVLYLGASTEETLHVKDANGKDWQNTAEVGSILRPQLTRLTLIPLPSLTTTTKDYIHRVKHQIWLQLNEQGEWIVNNWYALL